MEKSRTKNVAKNVSFALLTQGINLMLSFISRTVFIRVLSIEYLGINGLFSNILVLLSFAELGIGEAIIYSMYKPLAENDKEKIKSLMKVYEIAYRVIGVVVIIGGLLIIPFMDFIIHEKPNIDENINLIYVLFLFNSAVSYFYAYRKSIIIADQKKYIVSIYQQIFHAIQVIAQIFFLLLTQNYVIFLLLQIMFTIFNNLAISLKAKKMYTYLNEQSIYELDSNEKVSIITNIKALFMYKIGDVILGGSDNVIISALIGVKSVGLVSNYQIIIVAFTTIYRQILGSFTASVGNLNAVDKSDNKIYVFDRMFYLSAWISGFFAVGMALLINPLISLWLGEEFLLSKGIVLSMTLYFYVKNVHITALTYRTTMGFFRNGRYAPLAAAIINIILSIILGIHYGIAGIFVASSISSLITVGIVDPILVYRNGFNRNPIVYYIKYFAYALICIANYLLMGRFFIWSSTDSIINFVLYLISITIIYNVSFVLLTFKSKEFKGLIKMIYGILRK